MPDTRSVTSRHAAGVATPEQLETFLASDTRQVWALHRETGEPFYLAEGAADATRAYTKDHLRCPYPDCEAPITTRGGTRRDHFVHLSDTTHPGGPESESHLAGKAMMSAWLVDLTRPHTALLEHVREEAAVKHRDSADDPLIHRRPDVLATATFGARFAFEVEYKPWSVAAWEQKEADLSASGITSHWLVGHSRFSIASPREEGTKAKRLDAVNVPEPWRHAATRGHRIFVINPEQRQLAELAELGGGHYRGEGRVATLRVSSIDDCYLDVATGRIITPFTADLTRLAEQKIAAAANNRRRAAERARKERERQDALAVARDAEADTWRRSLYRERIQERFESIPWWLTRTDEHETAWAAAPALWRAVIWCDLIDASQGDAKQDTTSDEQTDLRLEDAVGTLAAAGIAPRAGFDGQDESIEALVADLAKARLVDRQLGRQGQLLTFRRSVWTEAPTNYTQSPAERLMSRIKAMPYEACVNDHQMWLTRFPDAITVPTVTADGTIRHVKR